jgi:hypothetical protein
MRTEKNKVKLERDKGIEPSPRPWQGRVLPLYESRKPELPNRLTIYSTQPTLRQGPGGGFLFNNFARQKSRKNSLPRAGETQPPSPFNPLRGCAWISPRVIFFAARQSAQRDRDRYKRGRTFHRPGSKRLLASGGASGGGPASCDSSSLPVFFSMYLALEHVNYRKFQFGAQVAS